MGLKFLSTLTEPSQLPNQAVVTASPPQRTYVQSAVLFSLTLLRLRAADSCPHCSLLLLPTSSVDTSKPSRVPLCSLPVCGNLLCAYSKCSEEPIPLIFVSPVPVSSSCTTQPSSLSPPPCVFLCDTTNRIYFSTRAWTL